MLDQDQLSASHLAKVIKDECLHWNAEAKKFVTGKPADEIVAMAGRIVLASAVAGPLTLLGLSPLAVVAAGAIMLDKKMREIPTAISPKMLGTPPD